MSLFAGKIGANVLIETIDSVQAGLFGNVVEKIFIAELQKIAGIYRSITIQFPTWRLWIANTGH